MGIIIQKPTHHMPSRIKGTENLVVVNGNENSIMLKHGTDTTGAERIRDKTMHKFRRRRRRNRYGIANITNNHITTVSNVTNVISRSSGFQKKLVRFKDRNGSQGRQERPPKLFRFCASGGLLDSHVVAGMSHEQNMVEGAKVVGYCAKGLSRTLGNMADSAVGVAGCAFGIVDALVRLGFGIAEYVSGQKKAPGRGK